MYTLYRQFVIALLIIHSNLAVSAGRIDKSEEKNKQLYVEEPSWIAAGEKLFNTYCSSCHNFTADNIGPRLATITYETDKMWIHRFIRNPQQLIDEGDIRANKLMKKYSTVMPNFGLDDAQADQLTAYLYSQRNPDLLNEVKLLRNDAIEDPVPEHSNKANFGLELCDFVKIPASSESKQKTKINKLFGINKDFVERLFVADSHGKLYEVSKGKTVVILDLKKVIPEMVSAPGLSTGFGSFTFSPEFKDDRLFYTTHPEMTSDKPVDFRLANDTLPIMHWVITEWKMALDGKTVLLDSRRELIRMEMYKQAHAIQDITFNYFVDKNHSDYGLMYIGVGDGGASYYNRADLFASKQQIWGNVLRIDPKGVNSANGQYGIPKDNPWANKQYLPMALPEIYMSGFRNPNQISFVPKTGQVLISDIGHWNIEEINLGYKAADYGWPRREGRFEFDINGIQSAVYPADSLDDSIPPVIQHDHDEIKAIAGGYTYYGDNLPQLKERYFYGDIVTGRVFTVEVNQFESGITSTAQEVSLHYKGKETSISDLVDNKRADIRFGQSMKGDLFILSKTNGMVWQVCDVVNNL